jgi:pyruvate/2-oxoglutarate dehydrogenase complex dihydrolipoamide acyltransferase (E2) component
VVIGEKHMAPFYQEDGSVEMREVIDLGITLDERIADGYYYSKTIKLLKHLLTHPELLDQKSNEEVEF